MKKIVERITELLSKNKEAVVVTVSGPSGSGKSSVVKKLSDYFKDISPVTISTDEYYIGKTRMKTEMPKGEELNFDHPASIDIKRLANDILALRRNKSIESPLYDMLTSEPKPEMHCIEPSRLIFIEGIAANLPDLQNISDISVFVNAPFETRLKRCIQRDKDRNGRDETAEREHFLRYVEPSYQKFYKRSDMTSDFILEN